MEQKLHITEIRNHKALRDDFISAHTNFVLSVASKSTGRYITKEDDEFSIALMAFDEAIVKYSENKGNFFSFASLIIKSRLVDNYRKNKNNTVTFSTLARTDTDGNTDEFEIIAAYDVVSDTALELQALKAELSEHNMSFLELTKASPKSYKTKSAVYDVLMFIKNNHDAQNAVLQKNEVPVKIICDNLPVKPKLLERHRKYIIAATVILSGDYPIISRYIKKLKGVTK